MIEAKEFKGVDETLFKKTVTEAKGIPVKIAERQYKPELDGLARVEISDDKKKAELTLVPPQSGGLPVSFEDVLGSLKEKGVVAGIKRDIIHQMIKEEKFGIPIIIAEEIPPISCEDTIKFHFDPAPAKAKLIEDEWGRVDFKKLNIIQGVTAGQVLATQTGVVTEVRPGQASE